MTIRLHKTLRRELFVRGQAFTLAISPTGLKLSAKGNRKGLELSWDAMISGDAALAVALNASLGELQPPTAKLPPDQSIGREAKRSKPGGR